jgi:hypothetical protein
VVGGPPYFLIAALNDASLEIAERKKKSRRRYSVESRVNFKKCSRHSSPAEQFHYALDNWNIRNRR